MSSVLDDKAVPPDDKTLRAALGKAAAQWDTIVARAKEGCPGLVLDWKHYGQKHGWQLKLATKRNTILYLIPHRGTFMAAMALNSKAVAALRDAGFGDTFVKEIVNAKTLPEGKAARVEVANRNDAATIIKLLAVKVASVI